MHIYNMQAINASNMNISGERKFTLLLEHVLRQVINTVLLAWLYPFKMQLLLYISIMKKSN